ncbi:histidine phosphatase family protein [Luteipulveratus halotolerans]|uniref:Histidine phosphatase n=1 Tax=Luteipulveratus halotolerans TaxID=1631356 RepID=A0A0L6CGF5_9MICO|nr:histidine phosphatase family protein [Luteipulveratus halotolerans]KNX36901.1 hypothetical protein VV01_06650 [Luteipulveratus halotolerans]
MTADVLIVLHAEADLARGGSSLTPCGLQQAAAVADRLAVARPALLLSEPADAAALTAEAIAQAVALSSTATDDLSEGGRLNRAMHRAARHAEHGPAVLVTDSAATVDLLRSIMGERQLEHRYPGAISEGLPDTAVTHVMLTPGDEARVVSVADVGHLAAGLVTGHLP